METLLVGVEAGAEDERVEDRTVVTRRVDVEDEIILAEDEVDLDEVPLLVHVPYAELQPLPQCPADEPHQPYWLQQFPNEEPWHVKPLVAPHVPSVDTALLVKGEAGDAFARQTDSKAAVSETISFMIGPIIQRKWP